MEDNRKEVDPSGQEHIEGEQNGQTVQPLVDGQSVKPSAGEKKARKRKVDGQNVKPSAGEKKARKRGQNVKPSAGEKKARKRKVDGHNAKPSAGEKKAKKREADKKCRERNKRKIEDTERQLKKMRAECDELKGVNAYIIGKLEQAQTDMEQCNRLLHRVFTQQEAYFNMLQRPWNNVQQPASNYGGLTPGGYQFDSDGLNYTSPPRAAMASGSSPMEGLLAPGGQLSGGITPGNTFGTMEAGPSVTHPPVYPFGTAIRPEGPAIEYPTGAVSITSPSGVATWEQ